MSQNNERDLLELRKPDMHKKGWTSETLLTHVECQLKRMDQAANERFELQGKAIAEALIAGNQRFQAQEKAIEQALIAPNQRFEAQEKVIEQRFQAGDRALEKGFTESELRNAQRFEAGDKALEKGFTESELRNEQRFQAQEKAVAAAMLSADRAVAKAEAASEKRFESVNEFRSAMNDQSRNFISRNEAEQRMLSNSEKVDSLAIRLERIEGRGQGLNAGWAILTGAVGLVGVAVAIMMAFFRR